MRTIKAKLIEDTVKRLCLKANTELRGDILSSLKLAKEKETNSKRKRILDIIIENAKIAKRKKLALCQDTGMVVVYLKIGQNVRIKGDIKNSVDKGVASAYKTGYFRKSIVKDPLIRKNTKTNLPSIVYIDIIPGNKIDMRVAVKGFGCENASKIKMFRPTESTSSIEKFIVDTVKEIGSKACPPMYIGIGIGGTLDKAVSLSKKAIFRAVNKSNKQKHIAKLEKDVLSKINKLNIGAMGLGGKTTALGVSILTYPTHIAGLPVAVNISCHATRDASKLI